MSASTQTVNARSAVTFRLAFPGLEALTVGLSRLKTDIADWTEFWKDRFAPAFYANVRTDFILEGGHSGPSWAQLSTAYAAWKAARFPGAGILVRSGALKASLAGIDAPLSVFRPEPTSLEIGSAVPYGIYHQLGGAHLPQRPPLRVNAVFMTAMGRELQKHVQTVWAARRAEFIADVKTGIAQGVA